MKILRKLLPIIGLLYFGLTCFGQTRGVSYDPTTTNAIQTVHQRFHSITNLASTAGEIAIHNAQEKLVSTNAAGVRGVLSVPIFDSTDPGASAIFPKWDDSDNEVDWETLAQRLTSLGLDSNDTPTFGTVTLGTTNVAGKLDSLDSLKAPKADPVFTGSVQLPNGAAPTTDATGEIAIDTTITDHKSLIQYDGGADEMLIIAIPRANLDTTDGDVLKYNAATDAFVMSPDNNDGGSGSAPEGTMVNTGASTEFALPYYTDETGTNLAPSLITTDSTKTNLNAGGLNANVLTITNLSESLSNLGLGTEDSPNFTNVIVGTTNLSETLVATATSLAAKGNLTGGNTWSGAQLLAEGASLQLDAAGSADGAFSGVTRTGTAGATLAFGDLIVLDATDSRWELADANSASGADGDSRGIIGICVQAAAGDGSATTILLSGVVRADAAFPSFTVNAPLYVSETAGDITATSPTTEDNVVRILGAAFTADEIHFDPDRVWTVYDAP